MSSDAGRHFVGPEPSGRECPGREFDVEMDLRLLVEQRTIAAMAARIDELVGQR